MRLMLEVGLYCSRGVIGRVGKFDAGKVLLAESGSREGKQDSFPADRRSGSGKGTEVMVWR